MGEYTHSIDAKGRLIIPAKFRQELGESFVITRGLDRCLFVFPAPEWQRIVERLKSLSFTNADVRAFTRFFFSGATEGELDKQGRVHLPPPLREYAQLEKDCAIIGVSTRVEIWSQPAWESYFQQSAGSFGEIAEKLDLQF